PRIQVTGSGTFTPSSTVSFPGAYPANHAGIVVSIYDLQGQATNNGRPYSIPGPAVISCAGSGNNNGGGNQPQPTTFTTVVQPQPTGGNGAGSGSGAPLYGQCG